jgi:hypothetical protein
MMAGAAGGLQAAASGGAVKTRNPIMIFGLSTGLQILGNILGPILAQISVGLVFVGSLISLVGLVFTLVFLITMLLELKNFTKNDSFNWWFIFIPCLNIYFLWILLPQEVTKAKQMAGSQKTARSIVWYIFLPMFALPSDMNDVANPHG